jgi:inhibitor of the pro-sigma K processing machinery
MDEVMKIAKDVWNSVSSIDFSGIWKSISSFISADSLGEVGASLGKIGDVGDITSFWPYILGLILILFVVQLFELPFQLVWNGLVGAAMLWLINLVGGLVGFTLKITIIKALIAGFFGIPGALAIILFEIFG